MWIIFCRVNTLRPGQNGRHFADDIFKCIFVNENVRIPIKISLKFVPKGPNNNIPALIQTMAWRRPGDKPLSGPMMVRLPSLGLDEFIILCISPVEYKLLKLWYVTIASLSLSHCVWVGQLLQRYLENGFGSIKIVFAVSVDYYNSHALNNAIIYLLPIVKLRLS